MPKWWPNLTRTWHILPHATMFSMLVILCLCPQAWATDLTSRSLQLYNAAPGTSTTYTFSLTINTASTIGSLDLLICSNSPLQDDGCTMPAGLDVTPAHTEAATGLTSFTVFPVATNELLISWVPGSFTPPHTITLTLSRIVNPNTAGSYYVRMSTYASSNGTGPVVDYGGLAFAITSNLQVSSYVPPYLIFCSGVSIPTFDCASATGDYINFGGLSPSRSSQAASQLAVVTNAADGYTVQVYGTTMISGNNVISALAGNAGSRPGSPQFGINLRANSVPSVGGNPAGPGSGQPAAGYDIPNSYRFVSNDIVASSQTSDDWRKYTVSYIVNVPAGQPVGVYATTLTYVGAGSF